MQIAIILGIQTIVVGCIYSLVALAYNLLFAGARVVNLAQGDLVAYGGFLFAFSISKWHFSSPLAFAFSIAVVTLAGVAIAVLLVLPVLPPVIRRWVSEADNMRWVISTLGASVVLEALGTFIAPGGPIGGHSWLVGATKIDGLLVPYFDFVVVAITAFLGLAMYVLFARTQMGRILRALSSDRYLVAVLGWRVNRLVVYVFAISAGLSALAGMLIAPLSSANPESGFLLGVNGFAAAVLGGFGDMRGALLGGLLVAGSQLYGSTYINSELYDVFPMVLLIAVLLFRPGGILQSPLAERI
jgi:branched-chain amino acid transport system permease protein